MAFEIESEKLTNKAIGAVKNVKPQVVKSHITKEMIEDYQIEQSNPIKIGDKYFRYVPASLSLELEPPHYKKRNLPKRWKSSIEK